MTDDDLFRAEFGNIQPLKKQDTEIFFTKKNNQYDAYQERRSAAESLDKSDPNFLTTEPVDLVAPDDELTYKKDGVQQGVFKNLRLGKYSIHTTLNLLGKSVKESRSALFQFIHESQKSDLRVLLIKHGKGMKGERQQAVLKSYVNKWLPEFDQVLCFHSALPQHGGTGAVYVLLKKSDDARLHNKERHQKRGAN